MRTLTHLPPAVSEGVARAEGRGQVLEPVEGAQEEAALRVELFCVVRCVRVEGWGGIHWAFGFVVGFCGLESTGGGEYNKHECD